MFTLCRILHWSGCYPFYAGRWWTCFRCRRSAKFFLSGGKGHELPCLQKRKLRIFQRRTESVDFFVTFSFLMWSVCLNGEYFYGLFNMHCKLIGSLSYLKLYMVLELCTVLIGQKWRFILLKTEVNVKQGCCISSAEGSKMSAKVSICMSFKQHCTWYFSHAEYCLKQGGYHIVCSFCKHGLIHRRCLVF